MSTTPPTADAIGTFALIIRMISTRSRDWGPRQRSAPVHLFLQRLKIFFRDRLVGINLQAHAQNAISLPAIVPSQPSAAPRFASTLASPGCNFNAAANCFDAPAKSFCPRQREAQIVVSIEIIGTRLQRRLQISAALLGMPRRHQSRAQRIVSCRILRAQSHRRCIFADRAVQIVSAPAASPPDCNALQSRRDSSRRYVAPALPATPSADRPSPHRNSPATPAATNGTSHRSTGSRPPPAPAG